MNNAIENPISYELIKGEIPVMLIAPHVFNHRRPSLTNSLKQAEPWTDYIVREVANITGAWGLILKSDVEYDPNYHPESGNPFKQTIRRISEQASINTVIDIHGLNDKHSYDVGILYPRGFRNSKVLVYKVAQALNREKLRDVLINVQYLDESTNSSLALFVASELRIPAIQVELARYIREDDSLRENFVKLLGDCIGTL